MRPGCGLMTRHTLPAKPNVGGKAPMAADPKASSTAESGKGAPGRGSTTVDSSKREREKREREKETAGFRGLALFAWPSASFL